MDLGYTTTLKRLQKLDIQLEKIQTAGKPNNHICSAQGWASQSWSAQCFENVPQADPM